MRGVGGSGGLRGGRAKWVAGGGGMRADVAIIGGGPAGYVAALRAAQLGARVVLVERDRPGGACLFRGCIPTKALLEAVRTARALGRAREMGLLAGEVRWDLAGLRRWRDRAVRPVAEGVKQLLQGAGVTVLAGQGRLNGPGRVEVLVEGGRVAESLESPAVVLAAGSLPSPLPLGEAAGAFWDSDRALALEDVPARLCIVGGGPVGVEFASIYHALGAEVHLCEFMPRLLPREDEDLGLELGRLLGRRGIRLHTGTRVTAAEPLDGGGFRLTLEPAGAGEAANTTLEVDAVLAAVGRRPAFDGLGLETVGLAPGWVATGEGQATAVPGIYAAGDLTGRHLLAHAASAQGVVAVETALGHAPSVNLELVPSCTYTWPEVASVGLTAQAARARGHEVLEGRFPFSANGRAAALGEREGFVKVVAEAGTRRLLGCHIIGADASALIHEPALGLGLGATLEDVERIIHAHPTLNEAFAEACLAASGRALHLP